MYVLCTNWKKSSPKNAIYAQIHGSISFNPFKFYSIRFFSNLISYKSVFCLVRQYLFPDVALGTKHNFDEEWVSVCVIQKWLHLIIITNCWFLSFRFVYLCSAFNVMLPVICGDGRNSLFLCPQKYCKHKSWTEEFCDILGDM